MSQSAGRLKFFFSEWLKVTSDPMILQCIQGYQIPFVGKVSQISPPSIPDFKDTERSACTDEILKLVAMGVISECNPCQGQFLSSYFLVPKPNGDKRFILNLKRLNVYINAPHFKMEDARTVKRLLIRDCFMASIDLKDAYYLISINRDHRKFLRFSFGGKTFQFNCLPFGLCTAPCVFTKLLKPLAHHLRLKGISSVIYLDDILVFGKTKEECSMNVSITRNLLESLGFMLNEAKCELIPSQECKFLGFIFNSIHMCIKLTEEKRSKILEMTTLYKKRSDCKIRDFAQFLGVLVAACPAVNYGWLYSKSMERQKFLALKNSDGNFDEGMVLSSILKPEFDWWIRNIELTSNPIRQFVFHCEIFTDASLTGWGAFCKDQRTHGWWNLNEKSQHINYLELKAVLYGLKCFAKNCWSCEILLRIDNTTAISYINRMGGVQYPHLNEITKEIWQWCEKRHNWIFASYINSKENKDADMESRVLSPETEWELAPFAFNDIQQNFGYPCIDLFASNINSKCRRYISWYRDPDSIAVDAFTVNWSLEYFYAFPPFSLILRLLQKIIADKAEGICVVPYWPTQPWFPLFKKMLVGEVLYFKPDPKLLTSPFRKSHPLANNLTLVAGKLSGKLSC